MNPLIRKKGICDPHIHVFEGKAYLYATHDEVGDGTGFCMEDWHIYSSEDLIEWKLERVIRPEEFYCGPLNQCWAVDAAYKNGKYYWYFSTGSWGTGVGVGESPAGPFTDELGQALVDYRTYPYDVPKWDPCVFVDDDGAAYLIVGYCLEQKPWDCYLIARLNEDMISLAEPLRRIEYEGNPCREDKPSIHKYYGKYYLTHSSYYAVADNVYGPYKYMGNSECNIDHGSFFTFHNQTYFASGGMDNPSRFLRASYLAPCHYRKNGEIVVDQKIMEYGCGQYDAAWDKIEAEWYFEAAEDSKQELENGGFAVQLNRDGYLRYPNLANIEKNTKMQFCVKVPEEKVTIEIREGSVEGELLGKCQISADTQGLYEIYECSLNCSAGKKDIYFTADGAVLLDWFSFDNGKNRSTIEPSYAQFNGGAMLKEDKNASMNRVLHNMEIKGAFLEGLADGGSGGTGELVIPYSCTGKEVILKLYMEDVYVRDIVFQETGTRKIGKEPKELRIPVVARPGINRIKLSSENGYQHGALSIDHITLETKKTHCKTYAAANGRLEPVGNGCWDGLPQREGDVSAFSGRIVKYLRNPGDAVTVENVDGGLDGGIHELEIRYRKECSGEMSYVLEVNGEKQADILLKETEKTTIGQTEQVIAKVVLNPGDSNRITLRKRSEEEAGIMVEAFSIY